MCCRLKGAVLQFASTFGSTSASLGALQDLDRKVEEALACPCVADLKEGPCGKVFVEAFSCYVKSTAEDKVPIPFPDHYLLPS